MLYRETVESRTFALLETLSEDPHLQHYFLVGGTALALQLGHRRSIDLDFFTRTSFNPKDLIAHLNYQYPEREIVPDVQFDNTLMVRIDQIKVDFIQHDYALLADFVLDGAIRLASIDDIAAMKMNAIVQSGERVKDFVDMAEIAKYRTFTEVIAAYTKKYPKANPVAARIAIGYFKDVNLQEKPMRLKDNFDWERIKAILTKFTKG